MSSETRFPSNCSLDVVGIGNAIVDVLVQTDDSFIAEHGLQKGGMALIDEQQAEALYKASGAGLETSGGSVANTMVGIAQLGGRAGFVGRVRDDQLGSIFSHDIQAVGARFETPAATSGATTARCLIYVTPDASAPCAPSWELQPSWSPRISISPWSRRPRCFIWRGTSGTALPPSEPSSPPPKHAEAGGKVACPSPMASVWIGTERASSSGVNGVDVLFANDVEIQSLYETNDFNKALERVRGCCSVIAITRGAQGSVVLSGNERWNIGIFALATWWTPQEQAISMPGVPHAYAGQAGAGQLGALCAGQIVTQLGAAPRSRSSSWQRRI